MTNVNTEKHLNEEKVTNSKKQQLIAKSMTVTSTTSSKSFHLAIF